MARIRRGAPGARSSKRAASEAPAPGSRLELRIVGGRLRGRKLSYSGDLRTRPMKDRVREALFNLIGDAVVDAYAVDLFAGSGAIGLEAVSRGSRGAVFIEQHFPTAALLRQSAATLGVADICDVRAADVFLWAKTLWARAATADQPAESTSEKLVFGSLPRDCPWIVFCSPPYAFYVDRRGEVLALIEAMWSAAPAGSVVVVEADEHFDLAALPSATDWQIRTYPPATIALYWKRSG